MRCSAIGSIFVSVCRWCVFVSLVQPVIVLNAVFCTVCSFDRLVLEIMGDHTVLPYSRIGRVIALYVMPRVSLFLPHFALVRALRMLSVVLALLTVLLMCWLYVSLGSRVRPSILGCLLVGRMVLSISRVRLVLNSWLSGVKSVVVVLVAFRVSWLSLVH